MMPAPEVYAEAEVSPFADSNPIADIPYDGILFATDRRPAGEGDSESHYTTERGFLLRVGSAKIDFAPGGMTWEEARRVSLLKNRSESYPLRVREVDEYGVLSASINPLTVGRDGVTAEGAAATTQRFTREINAKLASSKRKDVYVYVHGYKVIFENPVLVSAELWHFLGYEGVFIAFAWPSTPSRWAYFSDAETASLAAHNLRALLEYLAAETEVERIHVIGYSQGTRVVAEAVHSLALKYHGQDPELIRQRLRIGSVILVGSDIDRHIFSAYMIDGLLNVPRRFSVYVSEKDKALGLSRYLLGRERLGQMFSPERITPEVTGLLHTLPNFNVINVSEAVGADEANGHRYFRSSPWASSDILATLAYDLGPAERGLEMAADAPVWTFPPDYIKRLRAVLEERLPNF